MSPLRLIAINLTRRCNLACAHCYLDARTLKQGRDDELTRDEVCDLLDEIATCGDGVMVVLTGGEPLLRKDVEDLIAHGAGRGLAMVLGTNGMLLTPRRVSSLKQAGLLGAGISLDSLDAEKHDRFRGLPGAWTKTLAGIEECRQQALDFQIHFTVTAENADELPAVIDFARLAGARVLNVFFLICTGRGESLSDISPGDYERVLAELIAAQAACPDLIIRPRCAPQYKRIAHQLAPDSPLNRISGREADGCIAGSHYCRVTPAGEVTACPYIPDAVGSIRTQAFRDIWARATDFERLRHGELQGACGACEYRKLCGGCRARPVAAGDDLLDADSWCHYVPRGGAVIEPLWEHAAGTVSWSATAQQRLERIPGFLRKLVKQRAEAYVAELGQTEVTPAHLAVLSARRFGGNPPPGRPSESPLS